MFRPQLSITLACTTYLLIVLLFSLQIKEKIMPPISLNIDTDLIDNFNINSANQNLTRKNKDIFEDNEKNPHENFLKKNELENKLGNDSKENIARKKSNLIYQPLPEIPEDLRYEAFNTEALARFYISKQGVVTKVELIKPCNNPKLNYLLIKSLYMWRFEAGDTEILQDIAVRFKVD